MLLKHCCESLVEQIGERALLVERVFYVQQSFLVKHWRSSSSMENVLAGGKSLETRMKELKLRDQGVCGQIVQCD